MILFVLSGCSGSRNSQQEVVIEKSANNDKARQFVDQKNPHLGTQLEAESYTKQEAIEFLQNGLGIPTNDSAFHYTFKQSNKGSYVVQIISEKNSVSKENELFGYYQVYQDGIIVKMMEKDQTFQENKVINKKVDKKHKQTSMCIFCLMFVFYFLITFFDKIYERSGLKTNKKMKMC